MTSDLVRLAVERALCPGSFFVAPPGTLRIERVAEETLPWEIFRGHLLDPALAREHKTFTAWHVFIDRQGESAEAPLLSIRQARAANTIHVTRQILSEAFEAYEDAPGVILTRPVRKWVSELVGSLETPDADTENLADALGQLLFQAVIGTSRLPITSLETPLPDFSLGRLAYLPALSDREQTFDNSLEFLTRALAQDRPLAEQAKALETALRAEGDNRLILGLLCETCQNDRITSLLRAVFNGAALSPYTHFADALTALVVPLADVASFGPAETLDILGYMLRNLCRHLTAFDLTLFHNFGANYPDALFLDTLLRAFLKVAERHTNLLLDDERASRGRRRALRQACLARKHYEGHRVPDAPTSMGENIRVLPAPFVRVPEEQILEASKRKRRLFADHPTDELLGEFGRHALTAALADLVEPIELRELGMALYLDRPLGVLKDPGEVDRTPLVSYEAFSRSIARRRVRELASVGWIDPERRDVLLAAIATLSVPGVPLSHLSVVERPGVVSIADAGKAAADFIFLRTTRGSLDELLSWLDLTPIAKQSPDLHHWLLHDPNVLLVQHVSPAPGGQAELHAYRGGQLHVTLELSGKSLD